MSNPFNDYEYWRDFTKYSIQASSIALQYHTYLKERGEGPGAVEMDRFKEEAEAVAELWLETVPK